METSILTRQVGPLKTWVWMLIGLGVALAYALYKERKGNAAQATGGEEGKTDAYGNYTTDDEYATGNNTVPDFISQNYINTTVNNQLPVPPTAPPPKDTTTPPPTTLPAPTKPPGTKPKYTTYVVKRGDTLSGIAKKYKTTWQALYAFNTTKGVRPDATIATLKKRGPNLLYSGEKILIPTK